MGEMKQSFEIHRIFVNLRVIILNTNRKSLDSPECSNAYVPPDGFYKTLNAKVGHWTLYS